MDSTFTYPRRWRFAHGFTCYSQSWTDYASQIKAPPQAFSLEVQTLAEVW